MIYVPVVFEKKQQLEMVGFEQTQETIILK